MFLLKLPEHFVLGIEHLLSLLLVEHLNQFDLEGLLHFICLGLKDLISDYDVLGDKVKRLARLQVFLISFL